MPPRFQLRRRPLSDDERRDLDQQALTAEQPVLAAQRKSIRHAILLGFAVAGILALLWYVTATKNLDRTKTLVATYASIAVYVLAATWELLYSRSRVKAVRAVWRDIREASEAAPVIELEIRPARAWSTGYAWLLDTGDGYALLIEWERPNIKPTSRMVVRYSAGGIMWTDEHDEPMETSELNFDWDALPDGHPLIESSAPALFKFDGDPVASILAFADASFPFGTSPRDDEPHASLAP